LVSINPRHKALVFTIVLLLRGLMHRRMRPSLTSCLVCIYAYICKTRAKRYATVYTAFILRAYFGLCVRFTTITQLLRMVRSAPLAPFIGSSARPPLRWQVSGCVAWRWCIVGLAYWYAVYTVGTPVATVINS